MRQRQFLLGVLAGCAAAVSNRFGWSKAPPANQADPPAAAPLGGPRTLGYDLRSDSPDSAMRWPTVTISDASNRVIARYDRRLPPITRSVHGGNGDFLGKAPAA